MTTPNLGPLLDNLERQVREVTSRLNRRLRIRGCCAPKYQDRDLCMRCDRPVSEHLAAGRDPRDIKVAIYYLMEGEKDEYSQILEIMWR